MAKREVDREDLLREATALRTRVEFRGPGDRVVVIGFRDNGAGSFYFDGDPAYHFNSNNEIRRAYVDGRLVKAEGGRLVELRKRREADRVVMEREELEGDQQLAWLERARQIVLEFRRERSVGAWTVAGQAPDPGDAVQRSDAWLESLAIPVWKAAQRPHVD